MFLEMFKCGKLVHDRDYVKIQLKVSELDSAMGMPTHISKEKQLRHEVSDMKPPQKHVKPVVVDDDDDSDSRIAVSKTKSRQTTAEKGHKTNRSLDSTFFTVARTMKQVKQRLLHSNDTSIN